MFIDEMEGWFGKFGGIERQWITTNLESLTDEQKMNFMSVTKQLHGREEGTPTIATMQSALEKVTGRKAQTYFWSVCMECGCEYDNDLPICPACFEKGLECRTIAIKTSEIAPNMKVIRYNKRTTACYSCVHKEMSFCIHFGQTWWTCKDYRDCKCNSCCLKTKKENQNLEEVRKTRKFSYAIPIKKVN